MALLVALLTASAAPRFRGAYNDLRRRETVEEVALMLRQAQARARLERVRYRLQVDQAGGCLWLERQVPEARRAFAPVAASWGRRRCWPGSLEMRPMATEVVFSARGSGVERRILFGHEERTEYTIVVKADQIQVQRRSG